MIKETTNTKEVPVYTPTQTKSETYITYECSDGKTFTSEKDNRKGYKSGKQLAEEYEARLQVENAAKLELKFHSLVNDKHYNEGYEREFCFYYHPDLPSNVKSELLLLVYELPYITDVDKLTEGWYLVNQYVYEIPSSSMNCQYSCKGHITLLSDYISDKEQDLLKYQNIFKSLEA